MNDFGQCPTEGAIGLLTLLIRSGRFAESRLDDDLAAAGLTFMKWRTLDVLVKAESPVSLGALADLLHCVRSNVTQLVDKLEAELVVRRIADPDDRRGTLVQLTETGCAAHATGRKALESATREVFAPFGEEDRSALRRLLVLLNGK
ncbi:MAG TPA: MarR family transcriptional regulator [Armatimonadota bacterium]|jgi:DNA-binding MarR family transcriptional regulator